MSFMYSFKCKACQKTGNFNHAITAGEAGWATAHMMVKGKNVYMVFCPAHVPDWLRKVVSDGKRPGNSAADETA